DDEIDKMVRDAEAHAEEDRRRREAAETRNMADSLVYRAEKLLDEEAAEADAEGAADLRAKMEATRSALEGDDVATVETAANDLQQAVESFVSAMYARATQSPDAEGGAAGGDAPGGDDVIDAEILDEDEDDS
ncbi:MAG: Hsp70 family protein, partial [Acidimicrobiia bacterium]|nr:Hsp70 family protein [Acidimicrobiia bacterium]